MVGIGTDQPNSWLTWLNSEREADLDDFFCLQKSAAVTPQIITGGLKKSRYLVNGLLGFGLFAALFSGDSSFLFLGKITAGNDWLLDMLN